MNTGPKKRIQLTMTIAGSADALACMHRCSDKARDAGFDGASVWAIGITASELATNIVRHAGTGSITLRIDSGPEPGLELIARDSGNGIDNVAAARDDGFSQGRHLSSTVPPLLRGGLGSGLGAIDRLMDEFEIETSPERGTTVRVFKRLALEKSSPLKSLLLGLGNTLLRDDSVGVRVVREVASREPASHWNIVEAEIGGFGLLDVLEGHDRAIIVDAIRRNDTAPGGVSVFNAEELQPSLHLVAGHQIDLSSALELGRRLGRPVPKTVKIVGIQIEDDRTFAESCTRAVEDAIPAATRIVRQLMSQPVTL